MLDWLLNLWPFAVYLVVVFVVLPRFGVAT
jgi:hypothetical protein